MSPDEFKNIISPKYFSRSGSAFTRNRPSIRSPRSESIRSMTCNLLHILSGISISITLPEGHYKKNEYLKYRELLDALSRTALIVELGKKYHVAGRFEQRIKILTGIKIEFKRESLENMIIHGKYVGIPDDEIKKYYKKIAT